MMFFTADTHFGHPGALGLYRRPFDGVAAMDAAMERLWNATVGPDDEVWHLGDVAVGPRPSVPVPAERVAALLSRLHGRKHLVAGNNDPQATRGWAGWHSVRDYAEITAEGTALVLCHYALRSWNGMARGAINLHGHSHGRLARMARQFDVGVDVRGFRPVTLAELRAAGRRPALRQAGPEAPPLASAKG